MSYEFMGWRISTIDGAQQEALEVLKSGGTYEPGIQRELLTEEQLEALDASGGATCAPLATCSSGTPIQLS